MFILECLFFRIVAFRDTVYKGKCIVSNEIIREPANMNEAVQYISNGGRNESE